MKNKHKKKTMERREHHKTRYNCKDTYATTEIKRVGDTQICKTHKDDQREEARKPTKCASQARSQEPPNGEMMKNEITMRHDDPGWKARSEENKRSCKDKQRKKHATYMGEKDTITNAHTSRANCIDTTTHTHNPFLDL